MTCGMGPHDIPRTWKPDIKAQHSSANCPAAQSGGCYCTGRCMYPATGHHPMWQKDGSKPIFLETTSGDPPGSIGSGSTTGGDVLKNWPPGGIIRFRPGMTREQRLRESRELVKLLYEIGQVDEAKAIVAKIKDELGSTRPFEPIESKSEVNKSSVLYVNVQRELWNLEFELMKASDRGESVNAHDIMCRLITIKGDINNFMLFNLIPEGWIKP